MLDVASEPRIPPGTAAKLQRIIADKLPAVNLIEAKRVKPADGRLVPPARPTV